MQERNQVPHLQPQSPEEATKNLAREMNALPPEDGATSMVPSLPAAPPPAAMRMMVQENEEDMIARWNRDEPALATNLVHSDPASRAMVSRLMTSADRKTRNLVGEVIKVIAFLAHVIEVADMDNGEVRKIVRVAMLLENGQTASRQARRA